MNQRDPSPCCNSAFILFPSGSYVMCHKCRREYDIDYKSGEVKAVAGVDYPKDWYKLTGEKK